MVGVEWQLTGGLTAQVGWLGLRVGIFFALSLHLSNEPSVFLQWPRNDVSSINIHVIIVVIVIIALIACVTCAVVFTRATLCKRG